MFHLLAMSTQHPGNELKPGKARDKNTNKAQLISTWRASKRGEFGFGDSKLWEDWGTEMAGGWELRNPWQGVSDGVMDVYFQKSGYVKSPFILGCHNVPPWWYDFCFKLFWKVGAIVDHCSTLTRSLGNIRERPRLGSLSEDWCGFLVLVKGGRGRPKKTDFQWLSHIFTTWIYGTYYNILYTRNKFLFLGLYIRYLSQEPATAAFRLHSTQRSKGRVALSTWVDGIVDRDVLRKVQNGSSAVCFFGGGDGDFYFPCGWIFRA